MKYTLEYPSEVPQASEEFLDPNVIREIAVAAEIAGFAAIALSEHPAPSLKWRQNGGHNTLDPVAALSFMAGVTSSIGLQTNLYILPFRNPYIAAKSLGSLDILSGGRLIAGVGAGYLKTEFSAVGVDYDRRAQLLDESLAALRSIWSEPQTPVCGEDFRALGELWLQQPTQRPHPPIWIGGNSKAALRRVVEHGTGWMPIIAPATMASAIRTAAIEDARQFGAALEELRTRLSDAGRDASALDVQVVATHFDIDDAAALNAVQAELAELENHGANWAVAHPAVASPQAALEFIRAFSEAFIQI